MTELANMLMVKHSVCAMRLAFAGSVQQLGMCRAKRAFQQRLEEIGIDIDIGSVLT